MSNTIKEIGLYPRKDINTCIEESKTFKAAKEADVVANYLKGDKPILQKMSGITEQIIGTKIGEIDEGERRKMTEKEIEKLRKTQMIHVDEKYDQRKLALRDLFQQIMKALRQEPTKNLFEMSYKMYESIESARGKRYNNPNKTMVLAWCIYYIYLQFFGNIKISQTVLLESISDQFSEINKKTLNTSKNEVQKILQRIPEYVELVDKENEIIQTTLKCDFDQKLKKTKIMEQVGFIINMIENFDDTIYNYVNKYRPTVELAVLSFIAQSTNVDSSIINYRDQSNVFKLCNVSLVNTKIFKEILKILNVIFK
jgi:hypothetical protein